MLLKSNKIPLLEERTRELARRVRSGDENAKKELVELHMPYASYVANRIKASINDRDDILQNAYLGLYHAVERYDPEMGNKFSTYATWWIRNEIYRGIAARAVVHIPYNDQTVANMARRFMQKYFQRFRRDPTAEEIAKAVGVEVDRVPTILYALTAMTECSHIALDDPAKANHDYSSEDAEASRHFEGRAIARGVLKNTRILNILTEKERDAIISRFGLDVKSGLTLKELREKYGCTRSCINMAMARALRKLYRFIMRKNLLEQLRK